MKPITSRSFSEIVRRSKAVSVVVKQVQFKEWKFMIVVSILVLKKFILTFLSVKDITDKVLDISIQGRCVTFGSRRHLLNMEDYLLIYWLELVNTEFAVYTEKKLRTLHCDLGHPSVKALEIVLRSYGEQRVRHSIHQLWNALRTNRKMQHMRRVCGASTAIETYCGLQWIQVQPHRSSRRYVLEWSISHPYGGWSHTILCRLIYPKPVYLQDLRVYTKNVFTRLFRRRNWHIHRKNKRDSRSNGILPLKTTDGNTRLDFCRRKI